MRVGLGGEYWVKHNKFPPTPKYDGEGVGEYWVKHKIFPPTPKYEGEGVG